MTFEVKVITVIFKDGTCATFEHCLSFYDYDGYWNIYFAVDDDIKIMGIKYECAKVATIVNGYVETAI